MEIQIYLLNESLSNLVEVRIEGHFNLKARGLIIILIFGMFMSMHSAHLIIISRSEIKRPGAGTGPTVLLTLSFALYLQL